MKPKKISPNKTRDKNTTKKTHLVRIVKEPFPQALTENLEKIAVLSVDTKGIITSWNFGAEKLFGYKSKEVVGKDYSLIFTPEDIERKIPQQELEYAKKIKQTMHERFMISKSKEVFWANGVMFPLRNEFGVRIGYLKFVSDLTEQREFEKRKDEFINTATHEIRTPITTMKLFADIIRNKTKESKSNTLNDSVLGLNSQIDRLIGLTNYLLDVSKIQKGKIQLDKREFDLYSIIELLVTTLKSTSTKHQFIIKNNSKRAYGDSERINQVLTNILSNAIKYSPKGGKIIIKIDDQDDGSTKVSVQDFGLGISENDKEKVFAQFFRSDTARKTHISGVGLGLYISQKIIIAHGGQIGMKSIKGEGSTFFFTLPKKP